MRLGDAGADWPSGGFQQQGTGRVVRVFHLQAPDIPAGEITIGAAIKVKKHKKIVVRCREQ